MSLQLTIGLVVGGGLVLMAFSVLALRGMLLQTATTSEPSEPSDKIIVDAKSAEPVLPGQLMSSRTKRAESTLSAT